VRLPDGRVVEKSKVPAEFKNLKLQERSTVLPAIKWYFINGLEILEKRDWLGMWIPIIPTHGDELNINGKRIFEGIVRHSKDSQRIYNYMASSEAEAIGLAPKAP